MSERENIERIVHVLVFLPKGYDALERPITLVIEGIERIAFFCVFSYIVSLHFLRAAG